MLSSLLSLLVFIVCAGGTAPVERAADRPAATAIDLSQPAPVAREPRVLFITAKDCARCDELLARLRRPKGDFDKMKAVGWKIGAGPDNHLQIVDETEIPDLVRELNVREFPTVACVSHGEIVRSFKSGCTTPLDLWTFGFLAKGVDERPAGMVSEAATAETTGHYALRGNHWSIDEDWNPTREKVIAHLRGPAHGHQIQKTQEIETWSVEELRSLHDNLHEREMGGVSYARQQPASDPFSATRKSMGRERSVDLLRCC